ncbi:MAG: hypothetical protein COT74_11150 [Bdellovibrionales bacterium CG10_big_fil_rev_8_21_14_0_10_45_34]|nr:MAG: hypothetical protein COT74_11150 [Bdellovibrionales bacterium CG10_big_fil_rev_8_21_14_0_10_45_34]
MQLSKKKYLFLGITLIVLWQFSFFFVDQEKGFDSKAQVTGSSGLYSDQMKDFFYFFYRSGYFPLTSAVPQRPTNQAEFEKLIAETGPSLRMEIYHTYRAGELGKLFLYWPSVLIGWGLERLTVKYANSLFFTLSLIALFVSFWLCARPLLGSILVILLGSNPFQLYEVYVKENVFSWIVTSNLFAISLLLPLLLNKRLDWKRVGILILGLAVLVGSARQIRSEPMAISFVVLLVLAFYRHFNWKRRIFLALGYLVALNLVTSVWSGYFDFKQRQAVAFVKASGGIPLEINPSRVHRVWHPLNLGLGDFDTKYGHKWSDAWAYDYAFPILNERFQLGLHLHSSGLQFLESHDEHGVYYRKFEELPEFTQIVKEKYLGDIFADPIWFLEIIVKRINRTLTEIPEISAQVLNLRAGVFVSGYICFAILMFLIWNKSFFPLKLTAVAATTSLAAIVMHSGGGNTNYSIYQFVVVALLVEFLIKKFILPNWKNFQVT